MKKKLFTEAQIVAVLKQYEGGREAMDVCREYGISKATLFNWRRKYGGMETTHLKELKALQAAAAFSFGLRLKSYISRPYQQLR